MLTLTEILTIIQIVHHLISLYEITLIFYFHAFEFHFKHKIKIKKIFLKIFIHCLPQQIV